MQNMTLAAASLWEAELYEHLTSHEKKERLVLADYYEAAGGSGSAAFTYLADLIVEDEIRHHRLFSELASALRSDIELRTEEPAVPRPANWGSDPERLLAATEGLLAQEREDARELHHLAEVLEELEDVTLWPLLVRLMEMDTAKHIAVLTFVRRGTRAALR
jgi:recombinational DNA repair protein (RecF pathway)